MWVWRDGSGRVASVTGSIHQKTLDWLLAEDDWHFGAAPVVAPEPVVEQLPVQPEPEPEPEQDAPVLVAPKPYASKAEWVAFAVAKSASGDVQVSEEDAEAMTKDDLIELYGGN